MSYDRITQLCISGLRTIQQMELDLCGLTVLIGDNGTGKSSILEAIEMLRQAAKPVSFVRDIVVKAHGGLESLLRRGSSELGLGITIEGAGPRIDYSLALGNVRTSPVILTERVDVYVDPSASEPLHALIRTGTKVLVFDVQQQRLISMNTPNAENRDEGTTISDQVLAVCAREVGMQPAFQRIIDALEQIEVHVPFETRPLWQQDELNLHDGPRRPVIIESTDQLFRYGMNLPNAFQKLQNLKPEVWARVNERVRLGLGEDFRSFQINSPRRGQIELELLFGSAPDRPLPVDALSEGQLSYLAFLALVELHPQRSVLAFDEPEVHLHPALMARVVWMLEEVAKTAPVLICTHSDRLLDALDDPAQSVVLCELDENRATQLLRPHPERLASWLQDYRGFGSIRAEGYESHVFATSETFGKRSP